MSNMLKEALASAETVAAQLTDTSRVEALAARLAEKLRHVALTVARGSSDHAASYFASIDDVLIRGALELHTQGLCPAIRHVPRYGA